MSQPSFNLLDEPWLPVTFADGSSVRVGLLQAFQRSAEIRELGETSPPSLIAQYRLLLAILHRALEYGGESHTSGDQARWLQEGLPVHAVQAYLAHWRDHFYLFHPARPFMQVAQLATADAIADRYKPWTQLSLASASGATPIVFDHSCDLSPRPISAAEAITTLLGFLQFTPGGLVKVIRGSDKAGPLVNTAATLPLGDSLAATLALCLHPPSSSHSDPDLPAWEQSPPTLEQLAGEPTLATGPNDRYTRLSRAVLLQPNEHGQIEWIRFAAGLALDEDPHAPDPMAGFRAGSAGLVRLTFVEGRALWRDMAALLPAGSTGAQPAAILEYALEVGWHLSDEVSYQPLLVAGVASHQAKVLRWRAEQIRLPLAVLQNPDRATYLLTLVEKAELMHTELRRLATRMLARLLPTPDSRDTWSRASMLFEAGPFSTHFFATVERKLAATMDTLATDSFDGADDLWTQALREAAQGAWQQLLTSMGVSASALRADAFFWPQFQKLLRERVPLPVSEQALNEEG